MLFSIRRPLYRNRVALTIQCHQLFVYAGVAQLHIYLCRTNYALTLIKTRHKLNSLTSRHVAIQQVSDGNSNTRSASKEPTLLASTVFELLMFFLSHVICVCLFRSQHVTDQQFVARGSFAGFPATFVRRECEKSNMNVVSPRFTRNENKENDVT